MYCTLATLVYWLATVAGAASELVINGNKYIANKLFDIIIILCEKNVRFL